MVRLYIALGVLIAVVLLYRLFQSGIKANSIKVDWYNNWALKMRLAHSSEKHLMARLNTVSGKLEGSDVKIYEKITGHSNKSQHLHTFIQFEPNPFDFQFDISRKRLGGKSNLESGDNSIDAQFTFLSSDPVKFRKLLTTEVLSKLNLVHSFFGTGICSEDEKFEYYFMGGLRKEAQTGELEAILNVMTALIKASK